MTRPLFEIGAEMQLLATMLEAFEDDQNPAILADAAAQADLLLKEEGVKLDNYVGLIRQLEMEAAAASEESERWAKRAKSREARVRWLKDRLIGHLVATGRTEMRGASGRPIKLVTNGGAQPVEMIEGRLVPLEYLRVKHEPDKEAIAKALLRGIDLDFARLGERGKHLRLG